MLTIVIVVVHSVAQHNQSIIVSMRFYNASLLLLGSTVASVNAFAPQMRTQARVAPVYAKSPENGSDNIVDTIEAIDGTVKGALSGMALAAALWAAPATMAGPMVSHFPGASGNDVIASSIASAKEKASGTGTRVNKDPESLLRYGLPINNKEVC